MGAVEAKLARHGIPAEGDVLTSAAAAATLVEPGERVLVCGGPGIVEALTARGAVPVADGDADAVMVGFDRGFDYERLRIAATAVRRGARLIGTNADPTYPTPEGLIPGGGSILAAVATASGVAPIVAGKPNEPMAALVRARLGPGGTMVGDRHDTDGLLAHRLDYRFVLVLTGSTTVLDPSEPPPDLVAADVGAAVDQLAS